MVLGMLGITLGAGEPSEAFLVKPYLQLGSGRTGEVSLLWHTPDQTSAWSVRVATKPKGTWKRVAVRQERVAVPTVAPHRVLRATLAGLGPGRSFTYQVLKDRRPVFTGEGKSLPGSTQRVVVTGDIAMEGYGWKPMAQRLWQERPDYVLVAGDIVYDAGRIPEYRTLFFPVLNADTVVPGVGVPLLRSRVVVGALGNHDNEQNKPVKKPDGLAYYLYFDQPLNGPDDPRAAPSLPADGTWDAFRQAAGARFPRMGSFSFDVGPVHWTVLDSSPHVFWNDPAFLRWLEADLSKAKQARWKFVVMHHAPFHTSQRHAQEQWMRQMIPVFQAHGVDLTFSGHVHNYQRTLPLRFLPDPKAETVLDARRRGEFKGTFALDRVYDGRTHTRPEGIIHLVTGAGGAALYEPELDTRKEAWAPWMAAYHAADHSITVMDVTEQQLVIRQVTPEGREVDRFVVSK